MQRICEEYIAERDLDPDYQQQLRHRVMSLCLFAGDLALQPSQVTHQLVNRWITHHLDNGLSPVTLRGYRSAIIAILRFAADVGAASEPITRRFKRLTIRERVPQAWNIEQIRRLYDACKSDHPHWLAYCSVAYDTGLRRSDVIALAEVSTTPFLVREEKTGRTVVKCCRPETVSAVITAGGLKPPWGKSCWHDRARILVLAAGLPGTLKCLRRSHGTYVGTLDHADPSVFRRHYFDPRLIVSPPLPPPIQTNQASTV